LIGIQLEIKSLYATDQLNFALDLNSDLLFLLAKDLDHIYYLI